MSRTEMIAWVKELIAEQKERVDFCVRQGAIEENSYTWQDCFADYTNVEIETPDEAENLTDEELKQIVDTYI